MFVCSNPAFHQLWIVCFSSPCIVCHFFAAVGHEDFNISTQLDRKGNVILIRVLPSVGTLGSKLLDLLQKYSHSVSERVAWDDKLWHDKINKTLNQVLSIQVSCNFLP